MIDLMKLEALRSSVSKRLSEKRFLHTAAVADMAVILAEFCESESKCEAEIAALLHDITKEYSADEQFSLLIESGVKLDDEDKISVAVLHSFTAPIVIKRDFSEFASIKILNAVLYHTLGSPNMSVFDEIIFLADYIEKTRTYSSSKTVRDFVLENMKDGCTDDNIKILHRASVMAINFTLLHLIEKNTPINSKNILTRNALLGKI